MKQKVNPTVSSDWVAHYTNLSIMKNSYFGILLSAALLTSCAAPQVTVYCEPQYAEIYIDGQYQGNGIINYSFPREQKYITISCGEDGVLFYERRFYTRSLPKSINIYLDEYKTYSSDLQTLSTH